MNRSGTWDLDARFAALADGTRRDIIRTLLQEPRSAGDLARYISVSPQALSRHLRVLRKLGLVVEQALKEDTRVRIYSARPIALEPVQEWFWQVEELWRRQFQSFDAYPERTHDTDTERARRRRRTRS